MNAQNNSESLFTYLNRKTDELVRQRNANKMRQVKPIDRMKERRRHEYNKRQGML